MKTQLLKRAMLVIAMPVIYFIVVSGLNSPESFFEKARSITTDSAGKDFINLIFTDTYFGRTNSSDPRAIENNLGNFTDSLHFNSIHVYGYDTTGGGINSDTSWYQSYVSGLMNQVKNAGLNGYWGRNTIERLSYGQRLEYEIKQTNGSRVNTGFCYDTTMASTYGTDSGKTVLHPTISGNSAGWLCKSIYENLQHGDLIDFTQLDDSTWFIKPVMRIDSSIVDSNPEDSVVRIDVINYSGITIKSVKIKTRNFAKKIGGIYMYPGNYVNIYDFAEEPLPRPNLEVKGKSYDTSGIGLNYGMRSDAWYKWKNNCKVDFKVWWYGKVDVWFDKMVVDDVWGNELFNNNLAIRNERESKIIDEVNAFITPMGDGSFFIDEITHSQIPCVKRVYALMKQANAGAKLNFATTMYHHIKEYKDNSIGNRELLKEFQTESFNADAHEIQDILPETLDPNSLDPHINPDWLYSRENYTTYLQKRVFGDKSYETGITPEEDTVWAIYKPSQLGSLVYQTELARRQKDTFAFETKFIMQPQIHGVLRIDSTGYYAGGIREPLNEEIEAEAMLSIAHGAEGICWFIYYGVPVTFRPNPAVIDTFKIFGLLNPESPFEHRHQNQYGQDKWKAVRDMNLKIEHWKPTLDKINWTSGWSVHKDGAGHDVVSDIKSIIVHSSPPTACEEDNINYDCPEERYWEMGFFDPDFDNPSVDQYDKSKYFIMVNRRCVPDTPNYGQGDLRQLKIKFDSTQLTGFTNWKLIDLDTNYIVSTFNKSTASYINMGEFKPGEGKLYKLAPVMQEGGTLVADEECGGDIECKGEVNNNGKNIFLKPGTNISFTDHTARIKMTGGVFKSGYSQTQNSPVYLKGKDNSSWKGISLYGCDSVLIKDTHFSNISPYPVDSTYAVDMINCKFINIETGSFISEGSLNAGCIRAGYVTNEDNELNIKMGIAALKVVRSVEEI